MMLLGKIMLGVAGTALAGASLLCVDGFVQVDVKEKQPESHHIFVVVPATLLPIGVHFAFKDEMARAASQIEPWLPTIHAALDGLRDSEDALLVEVKNSSEHVRVAKEGSSIVVDVNDKDETVHVSVPIRAVSDAIEQISNANSTTKE